ncbi:MAG: YggS family pyridoxal phosphate-dependent enzyme [Pseudomonadota bacterium]|nr:YggS family pyridoxal phosphate-dependent enzyme [Pseudomonadales bacterium]MDY6921363.1 YggS family pyridoxal phosphate-dependent enzyme [Pseudomonadota bacterium]
MTDSLEQRYQTLCQRLDRAAEAADRPRPRLLAVSKKHSAAAIRRLYALGQREFGESYWQEAEAKMAELQDLDIVWHFIGPLQSNKTRPVAEHFHWVQSVEREKIARRLSEQRPSQLPPLQVCIQVNIDRESSKSGAAPEQVLPLARAIIDLPGLSLAGLMCLPARREDPAAQREAFHRLAQLRAELASDGLGCPILSMGMSDDLEAAIAEGSDLVRVGTALFGPRQKTVT